MVIKTILNNNAVIALDNDKKEVVIVKSGIGWQSKKGDPLKDTDLDKVFILKENGVSNSTINLLSQIDEEIIGVSRKIVKYGIDNLKSHIHDSIYVTLSDHISLAIERKKKGISFNNPLDWDIRKIYRDEYHVGEVALQIIKHDLNIKLPNEEAGLITLHFVNAQINNNPEAMQDIGNITVFIQKILNFIKYYFTIEYNEDSIDYYRFLRHLQFFAKNIFAKKMDYGSSRVDADMMNMMSIKYPKEYDCSEKIKEFIKKEYYVDISREEQFYLLIHINRLIS